MIRKNDSELRHTMFRKLLKKDRGSQGMTAAIILIAFIITASGIAFVILTMGGNLINKLQNTGNRATETASSYLAVQGNVMGYDYKINATNQTSDQRIEYIDFYVALTLTTGGVDLASDQIMVLITVGNMERTRATFNSELGNATLNGSLYNDATEYGVERINADGDWLIEPGEVFRFRIALQANDGGTGCMQAAVNTRIKIEIVSTVAVVPIEVTTPSGIDAGSNILS